MQLKHALRLHNEDEVTVKATGEVMQVVEVEKLSRHASERPTGVNVMLTDGNWYSHDEIS